MRIENLANDKLRSAVLLCFSTAENILPKGIQHKMTAVYGNKVTDESLARRWMRKFATDRETVCDRKHSHHHVTEELKNMPPISLQMIDASNEPDYHLFAKFQEFLYR